MKAAVIISGGDIDDDFALAFLEKTNYEILIGADKGICFLHRKNVRPTHIVGDFDSSAKEDLKYFETDKTIEIRRFRPEKDMTDTQIAVDLATELHCDTITILGGFGKRADHLMANIRILELAYEKGITCCLLDPHNRIWVTGEETVLSKEEVHGKYVSMFALGETVCGLTLEGFKYPLTDYDMAANDPLGVSNEIVRENARISFKKGHIMIAECSD